MVTKLGNTTKIILDRINRERERQDELWGPQEHTWEEWYTILGEEVGEVATAILGEEEDNTIFELIQVAAVCVAIIEDKSDLYTYDPTLPKMFDIDHSKPIVC